MGKASRAKRERREGGDDSELRRVAAQATRRRRELPVFWIVVGLILLGGVTALAISAANQKDDSAAVKAAADAPVYADVAIEGDDLARFPGNGERDSAVGEKIPTMTGTRIDGAKDTISADDGAQVLLFVAHWCPHCQKEVPRIVTWAKEQGGAPAGVTIRAISTAASEDQPNFPPAEWLAREDWPFDALVDDEADTAANAFGLEGYPYMVFVNADGTVQKRSSGEMEIKDFQAAVDELEVEKPAA